MYTCIYLLAHLIVTLCIYSPILLLLLVDLKSHFESYGRVLEVTVIPAKVYALTTYGFVTYANLTDASKALEDKNAHYRLLGEGVSVIIDAVYCYHCIVLFICDVYTNM